MTRVLILQHLAAEPPALIGEVLARQGCAADVLRVDQGALDAAPPPAEAGGIVVMGGPMGVHDADRHPWLTPERAWLREALAAGRPVLGVCLGAQLVAAAAGARVFPGGQGPEIGWGPVQLTAAGRADPLCTHLSPSHGTAACTVFHWHGDTFDLPAGATLLAGSARYPHQAFRLGARAWGFQFHFELTAAIIRDWLQRWPGDPEAAGVAPEAVLAGLDAELPGLRRAGKRLVAAFAQVLREAPPARPASRPSGRRRRHQNLRPG